MLANQDSTSGQVFSQLSGLTAWFMVVQEAICFGTCFFQGRFLKLSYNRLVDFVDLAAT